MGVQFVIAPPGGGKTYYCVNALLNVTKKNPLTPVIAVVSDRFQRLEWQEQLTAVGRGNYIGIRVLTFQTLSRQILEKSGDSHVPIPDSLDRMCVEQAIRQTELAYFQSISDKPGFAEECHRAIQTLLREGVGAYELRTAAERESDFDLCSVYERYQDLMEEHGWVSSAGLTGMAVESLDRAAGLMNNVSIIALDGFDSLTKTQRNMVKLLARDVPRVLVSFPGTSDVKSYSSRCFAKGVETANADIRPDDVVLLNEPLCYPADLVHITERLFQANEVPYENPNGLNKGLSMIEASTQNEEVREALRWIKARHIRSHVPLDQCALFVPDMATYRPMLEIIAREMGVPLYFPKNQILSNTAAAAAIKLLLSLPLEGYPANKLLTVLRTPYIQYFSAEEIRSLDIIARKMRILQGERDWHDTFRFLTQSGVNTEQGYLDEDGDLLGRVKGLPETSVLPELYKKLSLFFNALRPVAHKQSRRHWRDWVKVVMSADQGLNIAAGLNEDEKNVKDSILWTLDQLVRYETLLSMAPVDYKTFLSEFFDFIDRTTYEDEEYTAGNAVMVADATSARGKRYHAAVFLGLGEGLFPNGSQEGLLLPDDFRERIGIPRDLYHDGAMLIHMLSRADVYLLLTRPHMEATGDEWEASAYWNTILRAYGHGTEPVQRLYAGVIKARADAASLSELLCSYQQHPGEFSKRIEGEYRKTLEYRQALVNCSLDCFSDLRAGRYSGIHQEQLKALAVPAFTEKVHSVSAIRSYINCPFAFFLSAMIRAELKETPSRGMDVLTRGSLYHKILEETFKPFIGTCPTLESVSDSLNQVCERILPKAPQMYMFRPSWLWEYEQKQIRHVLSKSVQRLCESYQGKVVGVEKFFGFRNDPIMVVSGEDVIRLRGIIDRVDDAGNGIFRVYDYKLSKNAAVDPLQTRVYAKAVKALYPKVGLIETVFWGINQGVMISEEKIHPEDPVEDLPDGLGVLDRFANGLREGIFDPNNTERDCTYCPAASWCMSVIQKGW